MVFPCLWAVVECILEGIGPEDFEIRLEHVPECVGAVLMLGEDESFS